MFRIIAAAGLFALAACASPQPATDTVTAQAATSEWNKAALAEAVAVVVFTMVASDICLCTAARTYWPGLPAPCYLNRGRSLYWWNGGGEESVHSSVVAPSPHGFASALRRRTIASSNPTKNTIVAAAAIQ